MSERCVVCEASERLGQFFKEFGPSEQVTNHFKQSRIEFLKGVRALIDERIESISRPETKGTRVTVD